VTRLRCTHSLLRFALAPLAALWAACRSPTGDADRPDAPTQLAALATSPTSVRLDFASVDGAKSYQVDRAPESGDFQSVGTSTDPWFEDAGLTPGTTYRYRVAAHDASGTGDYAEPVSATTMPAGTRIALLAGSTKKDRTLRADTTYVIHGWAFVRAPATLRIDPGTQIVGDTLTPAATLLVDRGAKIVADGTAGSPIVFTSQRPAGQRAPGDWGGLSIVGNARDNLRQSAFVQTEGPSGKTVIYTGGTNDADNSGVLRYVRIEFAGAPYEGTLNSNSLSLYAVGSGTTIDHVQIANGLGDHFRWFGGTVDGRYLASYDAGDHHFDATEGYRGRNQFLVTLQTRVTSWSGGRTTDTPSAFVLQGCEPYIPGCDNLDQGPQTMPVFANFTAIGLPPGAAPTGVYNTGALFVYGGGGVFVNGIFARTDGRAVTAIDRWAQTMIQRDSVAFYHVLFAENRLDFDPENESTFRFAQAAHFAEGQNEMSGATLQHIVTALPSAPATSPLDWSLPASSPARTGGLTSFPTAVASRAGSAITPTAYRGAFDPNGGNWLAGWTRFERN